MSSPTTVPEGTTTAIEEASTSLKQALDRWLRALEAIRIERDDLARRLRLLTYTVGVAGECADCGAAVLWIEHHATGSLAPYDAEGQDHRFVCPGREL